MRLTFTTNDAVYGGDISSKKLLMPRALICVLAAALAVSLSVPAFATPADQPGAAAQKRAVAKKAIKKRVTRHWHGYGFLPGYRPPEVIARERWVHYRRLYGQHYYGPAWPRFYRGRWNGGGFGPCYTLTPIGYMWNCGR